MVVNNSGGTAVAAQDKPTVQPRRETLGLMGRAWVVGLAVVGASLAGGRDDAVCAAVVALVAFTVYFALSIIVRQSERNVVRP